MRNWNLQLGLLTYLILKLISEESKYLRCLIETGDDAFQFSKSSSKGCMRIKS